MHCSVSVKVCLCRYIRYGSQPSNFLTGAMHLRLCLKLVLNGKCYYREAVGDHGISHRFLECEIPYDQLFVVIS